LSTKCIFGEDTLRSKSRNLKHPISFRHPEFSSGSAFPKTQLKIPDEMLKQVQQHKNPSFFKAFEQWVVFANFYLSDSIFPPKYLFRSKRYDY